MRFLNKLSLKLCIMVTFLGSHNAQFVITSSKSRQLILPACGNLDRGNKGMLTQVRYIVSPSKEMGTGFFKYRTLDPLLSYWLAAYSGIRSIWSHGLNNR